ncbi:predicted protein [Postia placenta Mad-698-R]|nr:predicted protein [Postia placenta Mad-698-R]
MASDSDLVTQLLPLDELIQVVYQGSSRFVVLSSVESDWTVHVGLSGPDGRWWRGAWGSKHIRGAVGLKASSDAIEAYADRLADAFAKGEMCIGNWSSQKGAKVNLVLGTTTDAPAHVALAELPAEEAAAFATKVFTNIAIQAQSRGSRLHPSPFAAVGTIATLPSKPSGLNTRSRDPPSKPSTSEAERKAEAEITALQTELAKTKSAPSGAETPSSHTTGKRRADADADGATSRTAKTSRPLTKALSNDASKLRSIAKSGRGPVAAAARGASLANPTKKARKYQALEFGSDDDD